MPDDTRARVTISRTSPRDFGHREVFAQLDKTTEIKLLHADSVTREVEPGAHHLRVHNTMMWKNIEFTVAPGEHVEFQCINRGSWYALPMLAVLGSAPLFLRVEQTKKLTV